MDASSLAEGNLKAQLKKTLVGLTKMKNFNEEEYETDMDRCLDIGERKKYPLVPPNSNDIR